MRAWETTPQSEERTKMFFPYTETCGLVCYTDKSMIDCFLNGKGISDSNNGRRFMSTRTYKFHMLGHL